MNKDRKAQLVLAQTHLSTASDLISAAMADEQAAFSSLPAGFQNSARGDKMDDAISNMSDALAYILSATAAIEEIM